MDIFSENDAQTSCKQRANLAVFWMLVIDATLLYSSLGLEMKI